ncbi:MAG: RluA family pseudouridine synthase [Treponema sp.]|jgi:23S rRNA pseudouridine955/2504/2580 synthase|nr:RluA family pseudouridine synthase [Treponema sp.]
MKDNSIMELRAAAGDEGRRLDRILRKALPRMPLSRIHRLLREGRIRVDGRRAAAGDRVRAGQIIRVPAEDADPAVPGRTESQVETESAARPGPGNLDIIFESPHILALNKPAGLAVHGPHSLDTLARTYLGSRIPPSLSFSPGPLHRLDKPTSGIVVFSVSLAGARFFSALLREHSLIKRYLAVVEGVIGEAGVWEDKVIRDTERRKTLRAEDAEAGEAPGGKPARTRFKPLSRGKDFTLLELEPDTGRTHQIRAQAAFHGHPLAGDRKYGGGASPIPKGRDGTGPDISFLLHAWRLGIPSLPVEKNTHPKEARPVLPSLLEAPLPAYFRETLLRLFGERRILCIFPALRE